MPHADSSNRGKIKHVHALVQIRIDILKYEDHRSINGCRTIPTGKDFTRPRDLVSIRLFNIIDSLSAGRLSGGMPKRYLLSIIYFGRAAAIAGLITLPQSTVAVLVFGAVTGLFWLSTVPPTSSLVALMFRHALASHAVRLCLLQPSGRRLPCCLARRLGVRGDRFLPIVEKPVTRRAGPGNPDSAPSGISAWYCCLTAGTL